MRLRSWLAGITLLSVAASTKEQRDIARRRMHPWDKLFFAFAMALLVAWVIVDWPH